MAEKIKRFFKDEKKVSKLIFSVLILAVVYLVVGQGVLAYFQRTEAPATGWQYGYGYGAEYGYGYGYGYGASDSSYLWGYGFFGADGQATSVSATAGADSITVSYSTSYYAKNKVQYGTTSSLGSETSQTSFQTGSNSITVSSLTCGTTYYYRVASLDAGGNTWNTSTTTQATSSCGGGGPAAPAAPVEEVVTEVPTETSESTVSADTGGEVSLTAADGTTAQLTVPANAVATDTTLTLTRSDASDAVSAATVGEAPATLVMVGDAIYEITATDAEGNPVTSFAEAVTLTFTYTDSQIEGLDEGTLQVYMWDGTEWQSLDSTVDAANNTITATTDHFTYFAIMGEEEVAVEEISVAQLRAKIKSIIQQLIDLITQLIVLLQAELVGLQQALDVNLQYGDSGDNVELLQTWLAKDAAVYPEGLVTGWFGPLTKAAVIKFQEKYASEILTPLGLIEGTGYVGSTTRAKLNALYGE